MPEPRPCEHCGGAFVPVKRTRRFCSKRCSNLGQPRGQLQQPLDGTFYERHGERIKAEKRERYANDPEYRRRVLARVAATKAFPDGQPCEVCGEPRADRHHDDYDKPLDIRWLCRPCHIRHHVNVSGTWGAGFTDRRAG